MGVRGNVEFYTGSMKLLGNTLGLTIAMRISYTPLGILMIPFEI